MMGGFRDATSNFRVINKFGLDEEYQRRENDIDECNHDDQAEQHAHGLFNPQLIPGADSYNSDFSVNSNRNKNES